nr:hypothetical protein [Chitinophagaceae bacterium]
GIRYLLRKDIENHKWNRCIQNAANGLCYSDSDFLDTMATEWSALVLNDYEAVMPLTQRRKFGINYLYQPAFCQQTGITMLEPEANLTDCFLDAIPDKFKYWDIQLNALNSTVHYPHVQRKNYLLPLFSEQFELTNKYHRNAIRNIRKAQDENIIVKEDIPASVLMKLHTTRFANRNRITVREYTSCEKLLDQWSRSLKAKIIGAQDANGDIIASSGYLIYKNRITFIINGNNRQSLTNGASFLLKDYIIRKYSGSDYILDFEGSDNQDFARFYQQFGAETCEYYQAIKVNRLPGLLGWIKR